MTLEDFSELCGKWWAESRADVTEIRLARQEHAELQQAVLSDLEAGSGLEPGCYGIAVESLANPVTRTAVTLKRLEGDAGYYEVVLRLSRGEPSCRMT